MTEHRSLLLCLLLCLVPLTASAKQPIRRSIIAGVDVQDAAGGLEVRIRFNFPVLYLRHFPPARGDSLQIVIRTKPSQDVPDAYLKMREAARIPAAVASRIHAIRYEGDHPGLPWIVVDFRGPTHYRVRPGRDARSLLIRLDPSSPAAVPPLDRDRDD